MLYRNAVPGPRPAQVRDAGTTICVQVLELPVAVFLPAMVLALCLLGLAEWIAYREPEELILQVCIVVLILAGIAVFVAGSFFRVVPALPPHLAVVTRFGKPTGAVKSAGLQCFPFYKVFTGAILVPLTPRTMEFTSTPVMSRDGAQVKFSINMTWTPSPEHAVLFVEQGGQVERAIGDVFNERLRTWAAGSDWRYMLTDEGCKAAATSCLAGLGLISDEEKSIPRFLSGMSFLVIAGRAVVLRQLILTSVLLSEDLVGAAGAYAHKVESVNADGLELSSLASWLKDTMATLGCDAQKAAELIQTQLHKVSKSIRQTDVNISVKLSAEEIDVLRQWRASRIK